MDSFLIPFIEAFSSSFKNWFFIDSIECFSNDTSAYGFCKLENFVRSIDETLLREVI